MRKLTIKRQKSFVASLCTMKVYIEDPFNNELPINGVPCRKLGELKNGCEESFDIDNRAAKVFVIADKLSKELCNEFYPIPEGEEDIYLTGKNHYNPSVGNPFRFDGLTDVGALENRKKKKNTGLIIIIIAAIVGFGVGLSSVASMVIGNFVLNREKTVEYKELNMTLTNEYIKVPYTDYEFCYGKTDTTIFASYESTEDIEHLTVSEYSDIIISLSTFENQTVTTKSKNGLTYFEHDATSEDGDDFHYWVFILKSEDNFWMVTIATTRDDYAAVEDEIMKLAASVTFDSAE